MIYFLFKTPHLRSYCVKLFPMEKRKRLWTLLWAFGMIALFVVTLVIAFRPVIGLNTVFVAPDAPIFSLTFSERLTQLIRLPTLQNLILLLPNTFSYEGTFWIDCTVLGLAVFLILRAQGISREASCVGAFSAAFLGYSSTLFCAGHRGVVDAFAVTALAGGCFACGIRTLRYRWFILGAICCTAGLGAQADIWLLTLTPFVFYCLYLWIRHCPCNQEGCIRCFRCGKSAMVTRTRTLLVRFLLAGGIFLLIGIPAFRHTFYGAQATRSQQLAAATATATSPEEKAARHWQFITDWSLPPEELIEWILPHANGHTSYRFDPAPYTGRMGSANQALRQHAIHVGWITLLLALAAWGRKRDQTTRERLFWTLVAGITLVLAFGRYTPFYRPIAALPFFNSVRAPVKWLHLTGLALAILAGIGAEPICRKWGRPAMLLLSILICINGILIIRPYVFPLSLEHNALTTPIPPGAALCNAVRWPHLDTLCKWHNIALEPDPKKADFIVLSTPQPGHTPLAELTVHGRHLALYSLRQPRKEY